MNVGDKVVCIHNEKNPEQIGAIVGLFEFRGEIPSPGRVYVISELHPPNGIRLIGSQVFEKQTGRESGFLITCFRKLDEMKAESSKTNDSQNKMPKV